MTRKKLTLGTEADFFARGKRVARRADRGESLAETHIITFENPADVAPAADSVQPGLIHVRPPTQNSD